MGKRLLLSAWIAVAVATLGAGCKSSTSSTTDSGSAAAGSGGSHKDAGPALHDGGPVPDEINPLCPNAIGPLTGDYAPKGKCCYRTANSTRVRAQGDGPDDVLEFRLQDYQTTNMPKSIGLDLIKTLTVNRFKNEEMSMLWRLKGPRANGQIGKGPGSLKIAIGRYNCDGTYSFYSDKAAPSHNGNTDVARWQTKEVPTAIDGSKPYPDKIVPVFSKDIQRNFSSTPYVNSSTFALDWELFTQGFTMENLPDDGTDAAINCVGELNADGSWKHSGSFVSYAPMAKNDHDGITDLNGQTMCQLMAFSVVSDITSADNSCSKTVRCTPGSTVGGKKCTFVKLPDSLCPETDAEKTMWNCHVGDEKNPDGEKTNCTQTPVTAALDPDKGPVTTQGQCCDALGTSATLPKCNAYMLRQEFVAAAAEITDEEADSLQPNCHGK